MSFSPGRPQKRPVFCSLTTWRFLPFGKERAFPGFSSANNPTELGFTGHHQNSELGLVYMNARFYVPGIGRFASADTIVPDPSNPQNFNRYTYLLNQPTMGRDPDGHCWPVCTTIVGAMAGGVIGGLGNLAYQVGSDLYNGNPVSVDVSQVVTAAAVGTVAGAVAGATMGVGNAVIGTGFAATVATGAAAGVTSGQAARATTNVIEGNEITEGLFQPEDIVFDAAVGGLTAGVGYGAGKAWNWFSGKGTAGTTPATSTAGCHSFEEDTLIAVEEGFVPIAELEVGDYVLAYDETTGEIGYYPVTHTWEHIDTAIVTLTINGEVVETTPWHPFYTDLGWQEAEDLVVGSLVLTANGGYGVVGSVEIEPRPQVMYDLTVDVVHTYFVGEGQWLVHNCGDDLIVYRGGNDLTPRPNDIRINKETGLVQPGWGVSVNTNPDKVAQFGGAYQVGNLPEGLEMIQRGRDIGHYEIAPKWAMEPEYYQGLLDSIALTFFK